MKNFIERLEDLKRPFSRSDNYGNGIIDAVNESILLYNELHKQHTEGSFKVRVTNSRDWYSEKDTWYVKIYDEKFYVTVPEVGCQEGGERILKSDCEIIPETWTPKNGELIEVSYNGKDWVRHIFIGMDRDGLMNSRTRQTHRKQL